MVRYDIDLATPGLSSDALMEGLDHELLEIATVRVGPDAQQVQLPLRHLTAIPHFEKALCGNFQESTNKTIELVDENPSVFKLFVRWLYRGLHQADFDQPEHDSIFWVKFFLMADKWCLADLSKNLMKVVSNKTLDEFIGLAPGIIRNESSRLLVCARLTLGHPIRYLFAHYMCWAVSFSIPTRLYSYLEEMDTFALDLVRWQGLLYNAMAITSVSTLGNRTPPEPEAKLWDHLLLALLFADEPFPEEYAQIYEGVATDQRDYIKNTLLKM